MLSRPDTCDGLVDYDGQTSLSYDSLDWIAQRGTAAVSYAGTGLDPVGSGTELYSRGPDGDPLAYSGSSGSALAGLNRHGDLSFGFDAQGVLSLTRVFEPFGDVAAQTGAAPPALGFQGTGTTSDAVRHELATGLPTGATFHLQKAEQYSNALRSVLKQDLSYHDRLVAQSLLDDLQHALGGRR